MNRSLFPSPRETTWSRHKPDALSPTMPLCLPLQKLSLTHVNSNQCLDKASEEDSQVPSVKDCTHTRSQQWLLRNVTLPEVFWPHSAHSPTHTLTHTAAQRKQPGEQTCSLGTRKEKTSHEGIREERRPDWTVPPPPEIRGRSVFDPPQSEERGKTPSRRRWLLFVRLLFFWRDFTADSDALAGRDYETDPLSRGLYSPGQRSLPLESSLNVYWL